MISSFLTAGLALLVGTNGTPLYTGGNVPVDGPFRSSLLTPRDSPTPFCHNDVNSRQCWGAYNIDTDYYTTWPNTGRTRTYDLQVVNKTLGPDGFERQTLSFNGQIPGPAITADWGDIIVINVKNSLQENGTSIHWHGVRQLRSNQYDGVPGVTQCPIPPGETMTYRFQATQYGSSWYHSHFTLQLGDGLFGPINIRGPATANYDVDLGTLFVQDWAHETVFDLWTDVAIHGGPPTLPNGLINGTNTYTCAASDGCTGTVGQRFATAFQPGKRYLLRLVNSALDGWMRFSIDGHNLTVVANDFVPIQPWNTQSVTLGIGQRYDVVVQALNATSTTGGSSFWIRADWPSCNTGNTAGSAGDIKGIVTYPGAASGDPNSTSALPPATSCFDEAPANLVPWVKQDVGPQGQEGEVLLNFNATANVFLWTLNASSLLLNWSAPTDLDVLNGVTLPTDYNSYPVTGKNEWVYWIIQDTSGVPLTHPIHMHGHDFWVLAQGLGTFDSTTALSTTNPVRRDVAGLNGGGYLAIAFLSDNPGAWLVHCHIAWHASQGLAMQFIERESEIARTIDDQGDFKQQCSDFAKFYNGEDWPEDDSGI